MFWCAECQRESPALFTLSPAFHLYSFSGHLHGYLITVNQYRLLNRVWIWHDIPQGSSPCALFMLIALSHGVIFLHRLLLYYLWLALQCQNFPKWPPKCSVYSSCWYRLLLGCVFFSFCNAPKYFCKHLLNFCDMLNIFITKIDTMALSVVWWKKGTIRYDFGFNVVCSMRDITPCCPLAFGTRAVQVQ